jgi:AbrB family looped-hinge helix DNA binding protein
VIFIKEVGSIRKLDELGRVVIPKSLRELLNIDQGDNIEFYLENNAILLKKSSLIEINEEEIYKLMQLYYLKYYKSSAIVEKGKIILEYGKDIEKINEFISNKNLNSMNKKVMMKVDYNNKYYYVTNIRDKYHFIVYEDKMFTSLDSEILNFIIDYINKLLFPSF